MNTNLLNVFSARPSIFSIAICASLISVDAMASSSEVELAAAQPSDSFSHAKVPMTFRNGEVHLRVLDNIDGVAIAEGDIIFGDADNFFHNARVRSTRGLSNYVYGTVWPNGLVPYRISADLSTSAAANIRSAVKSWNDTGAITLVERTASTASAYPNFIDFIDANQCASWVGFQNTGPQAIYSGDNCSEGSMIHEIGHALGLLHEHTRPDRDSFVQINWGSITTDKSHNFDVLSDAITLGEYDYNSIMHYGTHFFSSDGNATITPIQNTDAQIGQRQFISTGDEESMAALYASELSIASTAPDNARAGENIEITLFATNNTDMGANRISLTTSVDADTRLVSFSSSNWICQQQNTGSDIICQAPVLAKSASSTVSLSLSTASTGLLSFDTTLDSNTLDTDLSNNKDQLTVNVVENSNDSPTPETAEPVIAAANEAPVATNEATIAAKEAPTAESHTTTVTTTTSPVAVTTAPQSNTTVAPKAAPTINTASAGGSSGGGSFGVLGLLLIFFRRKLV